MTRHPCTSPIISKESLERIRKNLDASEKAGVIFDLDGRAISVAGYEQGNFIGRTILSGVKEDMPCYTQKNVWPSFVLHRGREAGRGHYPRESQHDGQRRRTLHNKWWNRALPLPFFCWSSSKGSILGDWQVSCCLLHSNKDDGFSMGVPRN
jgi:hypothetical protein